MRYFNPEVALKVQVPDYSNITDSIQDGMVLGGQIKQLRQQGILSRLLAQNTDQNGQVDLNKALQSVQANPNQAYQPATINTLSGLIQQRNIEKLKAQQDAIKFDADTNKTYAETEEIKQKGLGKGLENSEKKFGAINQVFQSSAMNGSKANLLLGLENLKQVGIIDAKMFDQQRQIVNLMTPDEIKSYASGIVFGNGKDPSSILYQTANNVADNATSEKNNIRTTNATLSGQQAQKDIAQADREQELTIEKAKIKAQQEGGSIQVFGGNPYFIDKQGNATLISHDTKGQLINARKTGVGALPTPALKMVTEAQGKVGEADLAITKLDKLLSNVDVAKLRPWNNLKSSVKNLSGYSDVQSQAYERVVSGLKDAANAILMAAKGVQTDGDAQRAERIVMASRSTDPNVVKNAINDLKEFSEEVKLRYQNQIGGIYANYGLDPNDYFGGQGGNETPPSQPPQGSGIPYRNAGQQPSKNQNKSYAQYFD